MINVFDYIKAYCKERGITDYVTKSCVITKPEFAITHRFAPSIAFFYRVEIDGEIQSVTDLSQNMLNVDTPTNHWDFAQICTIEDNGTIQHAYSDFVFVAENMMTMNLLEGANAVFSKVYSAKMFYINVFPNTAESGAEDNRKRQNIGIDIEETTNIKS